MAKRKQLEYTIGEINKQIAAIFKKHRVRVKPGERVFWQDIKRVEKKSKADAKKLERLASNRQVMMSFMYERMLARSRRGY